MTTPKCPYLNNVTQKLVQAFSPEHIILFGSRARGDAAKAAADLAAARVNAPFIVHSGVSQTAT